MQSGGTEVTYEDQQRINAFNRTHLRAKELAAEIKVKQAGRASAGACSRQQCFMHADLNTACPADAVG